MTNISNIMGDFIGAVFWSLILCSLIISILGVQKRKPVWLIIGAILAVPLSLYLNMSPLFRYIGLLLPLFQLGASIAIQKKIAWLSWLLLLPIVGITCWLAIVVLTQ
jgi:hypothetical protein